MTLAFISVTFLSSSRLHSCFLPPTPDIHESAFSVCLQLFTGLSCKYEVERLALATLFKMSFYTPTLNIFSNFFLTLYVFFSWNESTSNPHIFYLYIYAFIYLFVPLLTEGKFCKGGISVFFDAVSLTSDMVPVTW